MLLSNQQFRDPQGSRVFVRQSERETLVSTHHAVVMDSYNTTDAIVASQVTRLLRKTRIRCHRRRGNCRGGEEGTTKNYYY